MAFRSPSESWMTTIASNELLVLLSVRRYMTAPTTLLSRVSLVTSIEDVFTVSENERVSVPLVRSSSTKSTSSGARKSGNTSTAIVGGTASNVLLKTSLIAASFKVIKQLSRLVQNGNLYISLMSIVTKEIVRLSVF